MSASAPTPLAAVQHWFERAVIGLNLCPFAKAVHAKGQIRWVESGARRRDALLHELAHELLHLARSDPAAVDTTVLVHPRVLLDFRDFNDFLGVADALLADLGLQGVLQIASFHPRYRFAGVPAGDIGHFTNRAPHPVLHLLREDSVARAVAAVPDADVIVQRNLATLRALGRAGWDGLGIVPGTPAR